MSRNPEPGLRLWRLRPWNSSPLMRGSDRWQATCRLLMIALALLAVPIAGVAGTAAYTNSVARIEADNAVKSPVMAEVVSEPRSTAPAARLTRPRYEALVRWAREGHGEETARPPPAAR
ncbi:hypothetical protein [Nocardia crassostreae]|uniref:hypothetical protein n=1 Tax=Nocardia crassostreae TaxID=53428 RepID=UPI00083106CC|nr:hypothetical protein [Nocardia crassostreae]